MTNHTHAHHHDDEPMSKEEMVRSLLVLGEVALGAKDYESAADAYASLLKLEQNEVALYNLASLYARGLGVRRNYVEAARMFRQAELMGNAQAGKLCAKCMLDHARDGIDHKTPAELYAAMVLFVMRVYPEAGSQRAEVVRGLVAVADTMLSKGEYDGAAKAYRVAAEYGADGYAQYSLAMLYEAGAGVPADVLAALYWLDRAVESGAADVAAFERERILEAYREGLMDRAFGEAMQALAECCESGTPHIPANKPRAARWRELGVARP